MRLKDLSGMINKLENLKAHAKTSQEIIHTLEDIKENLEYLEAEVRKICYNWVQIWHGLSSIKILLVESLPNWMMVQ